MIIKFENAHSKINTKIIVATVEQTEKIVVWIADFKISKINHTGQPVVLKYHIALAEVVVHQTRSETEQKIQLCYVLVNQLNGFLVFYSQTTAAF